MFKRNEPEPITVCVTVLSQMFLYLRSLHVDVDEFLHAINVDPEIIKSPDSRISIETYLHIQESAASYVQDANFGFHMGQYAEPGSWSILGYLMMTCRTLAEAMEKSGRYSRIIGNLIESTPHIHFNKLKLVFSTPAHAPKMSRHCFESALASLVRMVRTLTGQHLCPWEVTFTFPAPAAITEYENFFGCPVYFGQKQTSMTIDLALGSTPVLMANDDLKEYFEQYAREFLAGMEQHKEFTNSVTRIILAHLDDESLTIQKVARKMAVSVRTLQNRLENEGVVFSDLLTGIRQRLAKQYLREDYTVEQITYLLGFSEPSAFRKAFKKWMGVTPREFRQGAITQIISP